MLNMNTSMRIQGAYEKIGDAQEQKQYAKK
jgi:hypothetical protein